MSARKVKRRRKTGESVSDLRDEINSLNHKIYALGVENNGVNLTLGDSTRHLKQMCELCDKQRAQVADLQASIKAHVEEIVHLNSLIKLLVRGASA